MLAYPSLYEGFGHPPLEAMACGIPVVAWFPTRPPHPNDELVAAADRVLVDSTRGDAATAFPVYLELSRRQPVTDLAWIRLAPWRQNLVRLLSASALGEFASGVRRIESEGETGDRLLLAGWLMSRLGVAPGEALFVGDDAERDLHGARRAGLHAVDVASLATLDALEIPEFA